MARRGVLMTLGIALATSMLGTAQRPDQSVPAAAPWTPPRTSWGDPDLEGVWTSDNNFSIPLERPAEVADKEFLEGQDLENALKARARLIQGIATGGEVGAGPPHWYENLTARSNRSSLIIDPPNGRLPALTAEARARNSAEADARRGRGPSDSWTDRSLWDRCITVGLPSVMFPTGYNNNVQILQAPGFVTITHEMMHDTRVIPLDGRPHVSPAVRHYLGDSRGRWEGTTLVIDVTNFHPASNYRGSRETLHLIERYTRTGAGALRYAVTIDDPRTFERPWTAVLDLEPQGDMYEYACHEGNRGLENILRAARLEERAASTTR
ncbi:MAG TPA: hypothetical protein VNN99_02460 [Vicinamibacterales bacterium]|jgi:hypothetical protein|nr:hypothetical protein [Vicinamibacterales bacterium]